jgi:acyl-CoA thioester hydrolase
MKTYKYPIQIRFADLDGYFHVNHAVFFSYLEVARIAFIKEEMGNFFTDLYDEGILFLLTKASISYLKPIGLNDNIFVELWVGNIKYTTFTFQYEIKDDCNQTFAKAETESAIYSKQKKKPIRIPEQFKSALAKYLQQ